MPDTIRAYLVNIRTVRTDGPDPVAVGKMVSLRKYPDGRKARHSGQIEAKAIVSDIGLTVLQQGVAVVQGYFLVREIDNALWK
mgnify:CR=1 FL=1